MMTAIGTPTAIPVVDVWFWLAGCGDAELVGAMAELCDAVGASELVGLEEVEREEVELEEEELEEEELEEEKLEEEKLDVSVAVENNEVVAAPDPPGLSVAENGYGASEVVKLVVQQFGPPRPCPAAPAQHQLLLLGSQRLTSVNPSN